MIDPRTLSQNYGPPGAQQSGPPGMPVPLASPQPTDLSQAFGPALDALDPEQTHFARSYASAVNTRGSFDTVMKAAQTGQSPDDIRKELEAQKATNDALQMARETMHLSDQQFADMMGQLGSQTNEYPALPTPEEPAAPSDRSLAIAGLLALSSPRHGFNVLSTPFQYQSGQAAKRDQTNMLRFQVENQRRAERINLIEHKLTAAQNARKAASDEYYRLAKEKEARGDKLFAEGLKTAGDYAGSKTEAEMDAHLGTLRKFFPDLVPSNREIEAKRTALQAEQTAKDGKTKLEGDKAKFASEEKIVDNRRQDMAVNFGQNVTVTDEMAKSFNKETADLAAHQGIPPERYPKLYPHVSNASQSLDFQKDKFDWTKDIGERQFGFSMKKFQIEQSQKVPADKRAKQQAIDHRNKQIADAKIKTDQALNALKPDPDDEDAVKKWNDAMAQAFSDEWVLVADKRKQAGATPPTFDEYLKERYPLLGQVLGVLGMGGPVGLRPSTPAASPGPRTKGKPAPKGGIKLPHGAAVVGG